MKITLELDFDSIPANAFRRCTFRRYTNFLGQCVDSGVLSQCCSAVLQLHTASEFGTACSCAHSVIHNKGYEGHCLVDGTQTLQFLQQLKNFLVGGLSAIAQALQ